VIQRGFAIFFALHGAVHAIGFTVAWQIGGPRGVEYSTALLSGAVEIGDVGTRLYGLVWLAAAAALVAGAALLWRACPRSRELAIGLTLGSLCLCTLGLPGSQFGLAVDMGLLALLAAVPDRLVAGAASA
jgi:hypothetical protein